MVQTGLYGNDNRFILDSIKAHPKTLRGIALIGESITDRELEDLARGGVRGFRVNRTAKTGLAFDVARKLAERVKGFGMHVQFLLDIEDHPDIDSFLGSFATEVVIDHMGRPDPAKGVNAPGFQALIRLLKSGRGWAKMSAPYRTSREAPPYNDITPFAHALVEAVPDRLVWGSDWPHVLLETTMPNDGDLVDQIAVWVPDEACASASWSTMQRSSTASSGLSCSLRSHSGARAVSVLTRVFDALRRVSPESRAEDPEHVVLASGPGASRRPGMTPERARYTATAVASYAYSHSIRSRTRSCCHSRATSTATAFGSSSAGLNADFLFSCDFRTTVAVRSRRMSS